jgi:hypothetical protein
MRIANDLCARSNSIKEEALDQMILIGETSLHSALHQYLSHYHAERTHQGLDNQLIEPDVGVGRRTGQAVRRARLGGLLSYSHQEAA